MKLTSFTKPSSSFSGNVLKLLSGTAFAQLISLLAAPILTRLYGPEAYGIAAMFTSITGILGVIVCMRYELAIMLPEHDEEAANLLGVSLGFTLLISLLLVPLVLWGRHPLMAWLNAPALGCYLFLVPLCVFISGVFLALNYWNSRTKHFGRLSIARVTSSLTTTPLTLGLGFAGHATAGAMIGAGLAGQTVATSVLGGQIWRDDRRVFLQSIRWRKMWAGAKRHYRFPIFSTWGALINTASWQLPTLMFSAFFSPVIVGYYALGFRILQMPMALVGGAISQVFFQRAAAAKTDGTIGALVLMLLEKLLLFGFVPMLMLTVIGEDLFVIVFGSTWAEAGVYTQILSVWALLWFISSPLSVVVSIFEKQNKEVIISLLSFVTRILAISLGGFLQSPRMAVALFALSGLISYGYLLMIIFQLCNLKFVDFKNCFITLISNSILFLLPLIALKLIKVNQVILVVVSILLLTIYYVINREKLFFWSGK